LPDRSAVMLGRDFGPESRDLVIFKFETARK